MQKPTVAQVSFAHGIGVDIPEGATKKGVSDLLNGGIETHRLEALGRPDLPNDIALAAGVARIHPGRVASLEAFRQKGIRAGSVVKFAGDRVGVALGSYSRDLLHFGVLTIAERHIATVNGSSMGLLYNPPATHTHELYTLRPAPDALLGKHRDQLVAFHTFAAPKLRPECKFRNEYGEFWQVSAVAELKRGFDDAQAAILPRAKKPEELRFCAACGTSRRKSMFGTSRTCGGVCATEPLPDMRHCFKCGELFQKDSARGGAAVTCPGCRNST